MDNYCGPFSKMQHKNEKKTDGSRYVYWHALSKAYFWHELAYANKNLKTRTQLDKIDIC